MKKIILPTLLLTLSVTLLTACAQTPPAATQPTQAQAMTKTAEPTTPGTFLSPILKTPDEIIWADAPASLPPGAKIAVLEAGGLKNPEAFTFRLLLPPNYKLAPHRHPAIEHVTVISGTLYFGEGGDYSIDTAKAYPAGSVMIMPIGDEMFGFTKSGETVIQVHGIGPWGLEYVNPTDDPRKK